MLGSAAQIAYTSAAADTFATGSVIMLLTAVVAVAMFRDAKRGA